MVIAIEPLGGVPDGTDSDRYKLEGNSTYERTLTTHELRCKALV